MNKTKDFIFSTCFGWKSVVGVENQFLEKEIVTSLYIFRLSDSWFSSKQEAKLFYATRATRGHRFCGVLTNPRGKDLFLLGLFFG